MRAGSASGAAPDGAVRRHQLRRADGNVAGKRTLRTRKRGITGADRLEKGKVEMADGGTIFLDEIGDMPPGLQAKLLRVLQDHEFTRVGGTRLVRVNIRVIAATNKDLKQAVKTGAFREDLFFRLNVVTLTLPPLRERPQDITQLAEFFLKRHAADEKRTQMKLTAEAMTVLTRYPWPGNIRELDNMIARAVILSPEIKTKLKPINYHFRRPTAGRQRRPGLSRPALP